MISSTRNASAVRNGERTGPAGRRSRRASARRVVGGVELGPEGGLDAALDRQRSPVARRPGVAVGEPGRALVAGAADAEHLAEEHRAPRHPAWWTAASARAPWRMVAARSPSTPTMKPGWSTRCTTGRWKVSARSTKRVDLVAGVGRPAAAVEVGIGGEDRHRPAVEAGQPGHGATGPSPADLEPGVPVDDRLDDRRGSCRPGARSREWRRAAIRPGARGRRSARRRGGQLVDRGRQVGEERGGPRRRPRPRCRPRRRPRRCGRGSRCRRAPPC